MGQGRIDQQRPQGHEDQQGGEFHPVGAASGHHGGRDDRESHLEHQKHAFRDRGRHRHIGARCEGERLVPVGADTVQEDSRQVAHPGVAVGERERVAGHHPNHGHRRAQAERLHHDRKDVLLADHPGVEQRQPGHCHQQHQNRAEQDPGNVAWLYLLHVSVSPWTGYPDLRGAGFPKTVPHDRPCADRLPGPVCLPNGQGQLPPWKATAG